MCASKFISILLVVTLVVSKTGGNVLRIIERSNEHQREVLTGEFKINQRNDMILAFSSVVEEDKVQLEITETVNREVIISYIVSRQSDIGYLQVGEFAFVENIKTNEAYYLQNMKTIPTELNRDRDENIYISSKLQQQNTSKEFVVSELHKRYDMNMLGILSRSIGVDAGIKGRDSASAMAIFLASKALSPHNSPTATGNRAQRDTYTHSCPNKESNHCANKPLGVSCLGLCGPGYHCWEWVCGDCCYHEGCYQHDECCHEHGYISWGCISMWNFSCKHFSCN